MPWTRCHRSSGTIAVTGDPRVGAATYTTCDAASIEICPGNLASGDLAQGTSPICGVSTPVAATDCVASDDRCPAEVSWNHSGPAALGFKVMRDGAEVVVHMDVRNDHNLWSLVEQVETTEQKDIVALEQVWFERLSPSVNMAKVFFSINEVGYNVQFPMKKWGNTSLRVVVDHFLASSLEQDPKKIVIPIALVITDVYDKDTIKTCRMMSFMMPRSP